MREDAVSVRRPDPTRHETTGCLFADGVVGFVFLLAVLDINLVPP